MEVALAVDFEFDFDLRGQLSVSASGLERGEERVGGIESG